MRLAYSGSGLAAPATTDQLQVATTRTCARCAVRLQTGSMDAPCIDMPDNQQLMARTEHGAWPIILTEATFGCIRHKPKEPA